MVCWRGVYSMPIVDQVHMHIHSSTETMKIFTAQNCDLKQL
jgi:hypothetical protein